MDLEYYCATYKVACIATGVNILCVHLSRVSWHLNQEAAEYTTGVRQGLLKPIFSILLTLGCVALRYRGLFLLESFVHYCVQALDVLVSSFVNDGHTRVFLVTWYAPNARAGVPMTEFVEYSDGIHLCCFQLYRLHHVSGVVLPEGVP
jgi:hypothetical protein